MKIGLNLYSIRNLIQNRKDLIETLFLLKKAGCDFVQFSGSPVPLADVKIASDITKMPVILTHSPCERILHDLDKLILEHKNMKCPYIGLGALDKKLYTNEVKFKKAIKELDNAAKLMEKQGSKFFYHNHSHEFKRLSSGETIFSYMMKHAPHFNFTLDTYWVQYGGASILEMINKLKGRIECVHLKDYKINDQLEPEFAPLGEGNINFKDIIPAMKKAGAKYFFIEQDNAAIKKDGFKDIVKSIKYIKENF